jgi:hypothetical protein
MIQIFVEGGIDKKLIHDLILELGLDIKNTSILDINGWTNISNDVYVNKLKENFKKGGGNLVILDADGNANSRRIEVDKIKAEKGTNFELFLIPNDIDSGMVENVLLKISIPKHHKIFECFDAYKKCIENLSADYFPPDEKNKIYSYTQSLLNTTSPKEIDFRDMEFWDLNDPYLENLKKFLATNII